MKKKNLCAVLLIFMVIVFSGCQHNHKWKDATCMAPRMCEKCGESEGEPIDHIWLQATCDKARTCTMCGTTDGAALGHEWENATCTMSKHCSRCEKRMVLLWDTRSVIPR